MIIDTQRRLVMHGAVVMLIGLACGLPSLVAVTGGSGQPTMKHAS